ncbi:MAG: GntR family transcriptional regulator [Anaerolineaceae bacterium]|nr:GntR family transcriptional regulator [Anaerolineaceae bacterium]
MMNKDFKLIPPQKVTVVESIIEQIVTKIRDGELNSGNKLPSERILIDMLGVSRSSVREALQGLAAMGLVETRPGEGTFIRSRRPNFEFYDSNIEILSEALQKEMRHDMNQARLTLERGIVTQAAENITEETAKLVLEAWNTLKDFEEKAILDPGNMNWKIHDKFHIAIAEASGNPFLPQLLNLLLSSIPISLRDKNLIFGDSEISRRVFAANKIIHENLCKAIVQGNAPLARKWIQQHSDYETLNIDQSYGDEVSQKRQIFEDTLRALDKTS